MRQNRKVKYPRLRPEKIARVMQCIPGSAISARSGSGAAHQMACLQIVCAFADIPRYTGHGAGSNRLGAAAHALRDRGLMLLQVKTLPPIEVGRRTGESAFAAARRFLEVQFGCHGE